MIILLSFIVTKQTVCSKTIVFINMEEEEDSGWKIGLGVVVVGILIIIGGGIYSAAYYGNLNIETLVKSLHVQVEEDAGPMVTCLW